jgi:rhodanese-related sulfurtransferase
MVWGPPARYGDAEVWWLPFGTVRELSADELATRLASGEPLQLVDVRSRREYHRDHIRGAISIPITELRHRTGELDPTRPTIAICLTAHRSIPAVRLLATRGFRDVAQLGGGMRAWWRRRRR